MSEVVFPVKGATHDVTSARAYLIVPDEESGLPGIAVVRLGGLCLSLSLMCLSALLPELAVRAAQHSRVRSPPNECTETEGQPPGRPG